MSRAEGGRMGEGEWEGEGEGEEGNDGLRF